MRILLINPSERGILRDAGDRPPLGLLYIAKANPECEFKVLDLNHDTNDGLYKEIAKNYDIVGISALTSPIANRAKDLCDYTTLNSDSRVVVGGYHPTFMPEDFKDCAEVISGEGEYFLNGGGIARIEEIGIPDRSLIDMRRYNIEMGGMRTGTMLTSRGCPNACVFCGNMSRQVRNHTLDQIAEEIDELKGCGYKATYVMDDVFTINTQRAIEIMGLLSGAGMRYRITTRANFIDKRLVESLARTGCYMVSMGIETGNEGILKRIGKNQTKQQITDAVRELGQAGINTKGFFIIGLPGETSRTADETFKYAEELRELGMTSADFYPMIPYPGTRIWKNPEDYGIRIIHKDFEKYMQASEGQIEPPCETERLSAKQIRKKLEKIRRGWRNETNN